MWHIVAGLAGKVFESYQNRKAKAAEAKAAWEAAAGRSMENGWKDEYITVIITFPLWQTFIGNLVFAFTGDERITIANQQSLNDLAILLDTTYGQVMFAVVLAAVGIKGLNSILK